MLGTVLIPERDKWSKGDIPLSQTDYAQYTDGSKMKMEYEKYSVKS